MARLGQAAREYFICLYLGMVEELEAGGQGDILGVPPAEIQDDNAGISSVKFFYQTPNLQKHSSRSTWEPERYVHCSVSNQSGLKYSRGGV